MAVSYTQDQYNTIKTVADKMGSGNENFKSAVNKKYGEGAYDSYLGYKAPEINPTPSPSGMASATSGIVQNATPTPIMQAQVNPMEANIGGKLPETPITPPTTPVVTPQAITTPTQVEKTTTTTPQGETIVKKETPGVDTVELKRNADENRQREILGNLNEGFANAPDLFQNQETFRNAYGYATADDTKKKTLDAFFQAKSSQINNPDALFQQIATNQPIYNPATKKTPAYQKALSRFNDMNINAGLTTNELADKIRDGSINIGSQAYTDLQMKNPELIKKAEMLNSMNTGKGNAKVDGNAVLTNVTENITKDVAKEDIPNYQNMLAGNTQVKDALSKKVETETKINSLQDTLDNIEEDTRNDLRGKGKSEGYIQALISEKSKPIVRQLSTLGRTYSSQLANLQYYSDIVKEEYNTQKDERKTASDRAYEATKDTREFGQQKELADYQAQLGLDTKQAEFEQQMAQKAQIANDPVLATQDVLDTYAKLGILPERSQSEIIQSVQNDIAGGMTLGQSLTNLNKAFQSKPQYQASIASKPTTAGQVWTKLDDTTLYNQATGESKKVSALTKGASATDLLSVPDGTIIPSRLGETTNPNNGKECAEYINDIAGLGMGDTYASKVAKTNTQVHEDATVGNVAVWNPNPNDPKWSKYGHAGVIVGEEGDNWLIKSSNLKGDGAVTTDTIPKKSIYSYNTEKKIQVPQTGGEVMGSAGVPLSYQRRIEQMVPVQLRNSDAESKKLLADIQNMQKAGLSPEDATLMYLGFNVTDPNSKSEAMKLVGQARGLGESLPEDFFIKLSDYVNNGNIAGAKSFTNRVVEGTIKKQVGDEFVSTPNLKFAESTLARVESLINRNKDNIGPLSGRIADVEKKLVNDPDYQALKTLLSGSLADTRRAFGGTAVSQSELEALKDFIGLNTNMPIENLLSGLRTNLSTLQDKYQQQRGFYLGEETGTQPKQSQAQVKTIGTPTYQQFYN